MVEIYNQLTLRKGADFNIIKASIGADYNIIEAHIGAYLGSKEHYP